MINGHIVLPNGWTAKESDLSAKDSRPNNRPPFFYDASAPERGLNQLRLFELREYALRLVPPHRESGDKIEVQSSHGNSHCDFLWKPGSLTGRFSFTNYLGSAWIEVIMAGRPKRISFDVASPKLDFETEYRAMVENIAEECEQLLLDWGTPTTINILSNPEQQAQTLLERFLFLRNMPGRDKLELYLEMLQRRPHSRLETEQSWKPAGVADPSAVLKNPIRNGRDWRMSGTLRTPGEIRVERKYDSLDTPPNRFVKFALKTFRSLCDDILNAKRNGKPAWGRQDTVVMEATALQNVLDEFLSMRLFDEVSELHRVPFESITLQRREGYREILHSWLMLDAAAQICWEGRENAYDGTNRDVATLYEYWLYFRLVDAFKNKLGMVLEKDDPAPVEGELPFCCRADDGRLMINLKKGESSFCRFIWRTAAGNLRVHFFYNRTFTGGASVLKRGSYSKSFRPDYTLVIVPDGYDDLKWKAAENNAEAQGRIAYLHFDAKYRGENLPGLFGDGENDAVGDEGTNMEKQGSENVASAKLEDLYKMHTYNEAIRRTVGSYVLYPGPSIDEKEISRFARYHEIMPGIGAFAIRPGNEKETNQGVNELCRFIAEILEHQLSKFTQSYRIADTTQGIIRDTPVDYEREGEPKEHLLLPSANLILGYMHKEYESIFKSKGCFYCRATDDKCRPFKLNIASAQGAFFIGWTGSRTPPYRTVDWMGRIVSMNLVDGSEVKRSTGITTSDKDRLYYLFVLDDIEPFARRDVNALVKQHNLGKRGDKFQTFQPTILELMKQEVAVEP